ncbi:MAG: hypothetical protein RBS17_06845 [Coriobacteriia bacterium]|nr:hypothetical protein [Coriobacteriia bacterium]
MEVKLFIRDDCPACPAALRACDGIAGVTVYDLTEPSGFAEASALHVSAAPTVLVVDSSGREVAAWRGEAPAASDIRAALAH